MTQDTAQRTTSAEGFIVTHEQGRDFEKHITHEVSVVDPASGYGASFTSANGKAIIMGRVFHGEDTSFSALFSFGAHTQEVGAAAGFPDPRDVAIASIAERRGELRTQLRLLDAVAKEVVRLPAKHLVWKEEPSVAAHRAALNTYTRYVTEHATDAKVASSTVMFGARQAAQDAAASCLPKRTPRRHIADYSEHAERKFRSLREADPRDLERDHMVTPAWVTTSKGRPAYGDNFSGNSTVERTRVRVVRAENADIAVYVAALLDNHTAEMHGTRELHRGWERATVELAPAGWDAEDGIVHQQGDTTVKRITAEDVETGQKVTVNVSTEFADLYTDRR